MRRSVRSAVQSCFAVLVLTAAITVSGGNAIQLLLPGTFHGDEVTHASGGTWLAVTAEGRGVLSAVTIERAFDEVIDAEGEMTAKMVSAPGVPDALFLVRGLSSSPAGRLQTATPSSGPISLEAPLTVSFRGTEAVLRLDCRLAGQSRFNPCSLQLTQAAVSQKVGEFDVYFEAGARQLAGDASPQLLWAGDLDRDGRCDYLIDVSDHYNVSLPTLFLSGAAARGLLVAPVASFRTTGC